MKGTISLDCESLIFTPGENPCWEIQAEDQQENTGNHLQFTLIANEETTYHDGVVEKIRTEEICREEQQVEGRIIYPVDYEHSYDFEIQIPTMNRSKS